VIWTDWKLVWFAGLACLGACSADEPAGEGRSDASTAEGVIGDARPNPVLPRADAATIAGGGAGDAGVGSRDAGAVVRGDAMAWSGARASDGPKSDTGVVEGDAAPGPRGSCYARCGAPELLAMEGPCACDVDCQMRGDCCADKHELCAVSERAPLCTLTGLELDSSMCGTDLGWTFEHEGKVEILFGDAYSASCGVPLLYDDAQGTMPRDRPVQLPTRGAGETLSCAGLITLDKQTRGSPPSFAPIRLFDNGTALSSSLLETPLTGFSDGTTAYMIGRRGNSIDDPLYIATRDAAAAPDVSPARTVYRVGARYHARQFKNPTAVTVREFDRASPAQHDWGPGGQTLFLFGRGDFAGPAARAVYLSQQRLPLLQPDGTLKFEPSYFAGFDGAVPRWSDEETQAVPVVAEDFAMTMQLEVSFVPALDKWIMLYGGDSADWINGEPSDQPRHGALHMRMADAPWGPWTRATPVFWREHAAAYLHCDAPAQPQPGMRAGCDFDDLPDDPAHSYDPGPWGSSMRDFPGCIGGDLEPSQPNFSAGGVLPCLGLQRGNLYAPNIIESWTADLAGDRGYAHAATVYFVVSTWMPYQVILASLTLHLP